MVVDVIKVNLVGAELLERGLDVRAAGVLAAGVDLGRDEHAVANPGRLNDLPDDVLGGAAGVVIGRVDHPAAGGGQARNDLADTSGEGFVGARTDADDGDVLPGAGDGLGD